MRINCVTDPIDRLNVDTVCVSFFADERPLRGSTGLIDWRMCGAISRLILEGRIEGRHGEKLLVAPGGRLGADRLLVTGIGTVEHFSYKRLGTTLGTIVETLHGMGAKSAAMTLPGVALAGLEYSVAVERFLEAFGRLRRDREWLDALEINLVLHETRVKDTYLTLESAARGHAWVDLESRRYRCASS